jgi:Zn-dependent metalloprotease
MLHRRRPLACIVPPVLLKRLALEGDPDERVNAIETIALDQSLRLARAESAGRRLPGQRALGSLVSTVAQPNRVIHDQQGNTQFIGAIVRAEGQDPTPDPAVNEAYDGLGSTYTFFSEVLGRDSIDGAGLVLRGLVHFGTNYNNAMWDGEEMIFGDGDGVLFSRFTASLDVIGHELTHGVTQYEANLVYSSQSGALNESVSDVFGSLVKQYELQQTADQADWLIGPDCVGEKLRPALRSMKAPGSANPYDDQPASMDDYVRTAEDHGGVHTNSGIPNHAFYLAATELGGYAWERAGRIWYDALRDPRIRPNSGFRSFARATLRQAGALYGTGSDEVHALENAWGQVKVL